MTKQTPNILPVPRIISGDTSHEVDANDVADTMRQLGISDNLTERTTIYMDPSNRLSTNGIAYPRMLGRLRHILHPELRHAPGPIVRISTRVRSANRSDDDMNHTLAHELEHVAQMDRRDRRLKLGHATIWSAALVGFAAGEALARGKRTQHLAGAFGAIAGQQVGYKLASHERLARERARVVHTSAIKKH